MPINSRKHSKYVDGALYTKLFEENVEYIRLCPGDYLNIAVTLEDGSQTTINMFREPFPKQNADAILDQAELHNQFLHDSDDIKLTAKPGLFHKD